MMCRIHNFIKRSPLCYEKNWECTPNTSVYV